MRENYTILCPQMSPIHFELMESAILGLAAVLHTSALAWQVLKYAGALYLFYIAWATWRDRSALAVDADAGEPGVSGWNIVVKAVLLNVLNPKLTIFFLAFLPQFVDAGAGAPMQQMLGLSAVFMLMTFVVFVAYGLLAHAFRVCVIDSPRVQDVLRRTFAASFAGLGAHLGTERARARKKGRATPAARLPSVPVSSSSYAARCTCAAGVADSGARAARQASARSRSGATASPSTV